MISFEASVKEISLRFLNAMDVAELIAILVAVLGPLGCDYFSFGGSSSKTLGPKMQDLGINFFYSNLPADFLAQNPNPLMGNITVRYALEQGQDSLWLRQGVWKDARPEEIALCQAFHNAGFLRGFTGVLSRQPGYYTFMSFHLDRLSDAEFARAWPNLKPKLMAIAGVFDKIFLNRHMVAHFSLSPRERDVLSWLFVGARPDEIADRLGVSTGTVDKYIVNAKAKLSARTRDHAVARALMLGLINP